MVEFRAKKSSFLGGIMQLREGAKTILDQKKYDRRAPDQDSENTLCLLQTVLSAEILCVLRYTALALTEHALENPWHGKAFLAQADDERRHMLLAADKIRQLGGSPEFKVSCPTIFSDCLDDSRDVAVLLEENLVVERVLIDHYLDLIRHFSACDPETAVMLQDIMQEEEYHIHDMQDLCAICGE